MDLPDPMDEPAYYAVVTNPISLRHIQVWSVAVFLPPALIIILGKGAES